MSNIYTYQTKDEIAEEASLWVVRIDNRELTEQERQTLHDWLASSESHRREFRELAAVWNSLDALRLLENIVASGNAATSQAADITPTRRIRYFAVAASILVVGLLAVSFPKYGAMFGHGDVVELATSDDYQTPIGVHKKVTLRDGSLVSINTDSKISVDLRAEHRDIHLQQGEAHFDVHHDPTRPFRVFVDGHVITAVGTAFNVRLIDGGVRVMVTEGKVRVEKERVESSSASTEQSTVTPIPLVAGQQLELNGRATHEAPSPSQIEEKQLAWRENILVFEGDPLEHAISELNRYTEIEVVIQDQTIKDLRVGGVFQIGETHAMLEAFERSFDLRVEQVNDQLIYLSRARK